MRIDNPRCAHAHGTPHTEWCRATITLSEVRLDKWEEALRRADEARVPVEVYVTMLLPEPT